MSSSEPLLAVAGLSAAWSGTPVLRDVSFDLHDGELLALLGPNGSGKTTLLRCLAGLERPTAGSVRLGGQEVTGVPTHRRGIGLMSQEPALFPNRTVAENIAYAPLLQRLPDAEVQERVEGLVRLLRLDGFEARAPDQLSGGERQRVALARTLAARPRVVLLDEPFASIDVGLRSELRAEFRRVLRALGTAAVHVTHDREEGLFLGDRVGLLFEGVLETVGPPDAVFREPRTERTARFLGYNVLPGPSGPEAVHPNDVRLRPQETEGLPAIVEAVGTTGRETLVVLQAELGGRVEARSVGSAAALSPGSRVRMTWERSVPLVGSDPGRLPEDRAAA